MSANGGIGNPKIIASNIDKVADLTIDCELPEFENNANCITYMENG